MNRFSIAYKSNEWHYSVVRIDFPLFILLNVLFVLLYFFVKSTKSLVIEITFSVFIIKIKAVGLFIALFLGVGCLNLI